MAKTLDAHPIGAILPSMKDDDYDRLVENMRKNGFDPKEPVVMYEGKILDGNHRYTAAKKTRKEPVFTEYKGNDPVGFVIGKNLARRNLTPSQAATAAADLVEKSQEMAKAAKEAAKGAGKNGKNTAKLQSSKISVPKAAKITGVSARSAATAAALKKKDPKKFEDVKAGKVSLNKAAKAADKDKSDKDKKSSEFQQAVDRIEAVAADYGKIATMRLTAKEVMALSALDKAEMLRVKPYITEGWKLKAALSWKSTPLSYAHSLRQACERAVETGKVVWESPEGSWIVTIERKAKS